MSLILIISILLSVGAISAVNINDIDNNNANFQLDDDSNLYSGCDSNIYVETSEDNQIDMGEDNTNLSSNLIDDNNKDKLDDSPNSGSEISSDSESEDLTGIDDNQNGNTLKAGEIQTVEVSTWTELKSYAESTNPIIIKIKDNTQIIPTGKLTIKSNVTIYGGESSFIGGTYESPVNLTDDLILLDGGDISINLINLNFQYMNNFFIAKINSNYVNTFENCSFISNYNMKDRSCIVQLAYGFLNMFNTRFINNSVTYGIVSNYNSKSVENVHMNMSACVFEDNLSRDVGGGINNCGYLNIVNSSFSRNSARGGPLGWGGAMHNHYNATVVIYNSNFTDNFAAWQGGAICNYGNVEVYNSNFIGNNNTGTFGGAAIFSYPYGSMPNVYVLNSTFIKNTELTVTANGGAIDYMGNGNFTCLNSTFISNSATKGQAIFVTRQAYYGTTSSASPNIIIAGNKFINHAGNGETMEVYSTNKTLWIIENNTYENSRVIFKTFNISTPITTYNVNSNIRFTYSVVLNNSLSYDADILKKAKFNIMVDGVKEGTVSSINNYFYINIGSEGPHNVSLTNPQFVGSSNKVTLDIIKGEIQFLNPVDIINYGDILDVSLKVYDTVDKVYLTSGNITLMIINNRSEVLFNQTYELGGETFHVNIPIYSRFDFGLFASFYKEDYGHINNTSYILMNTESVPINITINASNLTIYYTNTSYLTFNLLNYTDAISDAEVLFRIDKTDYNMTTDEDGYISLKLPSLNVGDYDVCIKYDQFEKNITISVKPIPFKFTSVTKKLIKGQYFKAYLKDSSGKALSKRVVTIKIGSSTYKRTTDSKGMVSVLVNFNPKTYNVKLHHDFYSVSSKLTVNKIPIKFTSITKTVKRGKYFKLRVLDKFNKAVKSKVIVVKIKSKTYKKKTDSKGYIKIKINLKPGRYKVTYKLSADKVYGTGKTSGSTTIRVKR